MVVDLPAPFGPKIQRTGLPARENQRRRRPSKPEPSCQLFRCDGNFAHSRRSLRAHPRRSTMSYYAGPTCKFRAICVLGIQLDFVDTGVVPLCGTPRCRRTASTAGSSTRKTAPPVCRYSRKFFRRVPARCHSKCSNPNLCLCPPVWSCKRDRNAMRLAQAGTGIRKTAAPHCRDPGACELSVSRHRLPDIASKALLIMSKNTCIN